MGGHFLACFLPVCFPLPLAEASAKAETTGRVEAIVTPVARKVRRLWEEADALVVAVLVEAVGATAALSALAASC